MTKIRADHLRRLPLFGFREKEAAKLFRDAVKRGEETPFFIGPFETSMGGHLLYVEEIVPERRLSLEEVREKVTKSLLKRERSKLERSLLREATWYVRDPWVDPKCDSGHGGVAPWCAEDQVPKLLSTSLSMGNLDRSGFKDLQGALLRDLPKDTKVIWESVGFSGESVVLVERKKGRKKTRGLLFVRMPPRGIADGTWATVVDAIGPLGVQGVRSVSIRCMVGNDVVENVAAIGKESGGWLIPEKLFRLHPGYGSFVEEKPDAWRCMPLRLGKLQGKVRLGDRSLAEDEGWKPMDDDRKEHRLIACALDAEYWNYGFDRSLLLKKTKLRQKLYCGRVQKSGRFRIDVPPGEYKVGLLPPEEGGPSCAAGDGGGDVDLFRVRKGKVQKVSNIELCD